MASPSFGALSFTIGGTWDTAARAQAASDAMTAIVNRYNSYGNFGNYNIYCYYDAGIPTAQASYLGSIGFGGTYPAERVAQHESNHYLGSGTTTAWTNKFTSGLWTGAKVNALVAQFDGDGEVLHQSGVHFYPYGLNYDTEVVNSSVLMRNIAIMYAIRQDTGLGTQADPWSAKAVTLTASDTSGQSSFNWFGKWSDNDFAHTNADYYTGNFAIRTPLDTYTTTDPTPSFIFVGDSLTLNNKGNTAGGLIYQSKGTTGVMTFKNLILDGGSIHHQSTSSDLFQLAGKVKVVSASAINPTNGNINVLADVSGVGPLTIGTSTVGGTVTFSSANNSYRGNINVLGRFALASGADLDFVIGDNGVNNAITGSTAAAVNLNGTFTFDLTAAGASVGNFWSIVTASNTVYGSTFAVTGFTEISSGIWSSGTGYYFAESSGKLSFGSPITSAVPEPAAIGGIALAATGLLRRRRRAGDTIK
ncbi:MAG: PEP-CTERM sorting domain-containing protein [Tepidisphaeraceae bacterium]